MKMIHIKSLILILKFKNNFILKEIFFKGIPNPQSPIPIKSTFYLKINKTI